jgi:hypothetical protein
MSNPTFIATPTNSDKNLLGWNSRHIYIHASQGEITVGGNEEGKTEVFKTIGVEFTKGSVYLNADYFNCDDGNLFKITMYFLTTFDGSTLRFGTGLKFGNDAEAILETKNGTFHTLPTKTGYKGLCKYEVILTKFKVPDGDIFLLINGNIIYSRSGETSGEFDADVSFIPQHGKITVLPNLESNLIINVSGSASIDIKSITIEEIK